MFKKIFSVAGAFIGGVFVGILAHEKFVDRLLGSAFQGAEIYIKKSEEELKAEKEKAIKELVSKFVKSKEDVLKNEKEKTEEDLKAEMDEKANELIKELFGDIFKTEED